MKKINEIFLSLQGEGCHSGVPCVFIRFSGCNKHCSFCDTSHEDGTMMSDDEIEDAVCRFNAEWIVLTGGEPGLWIDNEFISRLKKTTGKKIAIETNGSIELPEGIDWITVSPKGGIGGVESYGIKVSHADEVKVVDVGQPLDAYFALPCVNSGTLMYLQPCHTENDDETRSNRLSTVQRVLDDPRWTLSVQLHRFLGIP